MKNFKRVSKYILEFQRQFGKKNQKTKFHKTIFFLKLELKTYNQKL